MINTIDPKVTDKPIARCAECDREMSHYNTFISPENVRRVICWNCLARDEKGFNATPDFHRMTRRGLIPR